MNDLAVFNNLDFGSVRTLMVGDIPYFVGKDVANILGYVNPQKAICTHVDEEDKMLNVVLLSQFRKYRAYAEGVTSTFKPVIMFKSPKIKVSLEATQMFNELIANLNAADLIAFIIRQQLLDSNESSALELAYNFYLKNEDDLYRLN